MTIAIFSDIHSNLEALSAVREDIYKRNITECYCLGNIVGNGPNPNECVDLVKEMCKSDQITFGAFDQAVFEPETRYSFSLKSQLTFKWIDKVIKRSNLNFLRNLKEHINLKDCSLAHASPTNKLYSYLGMYDYAYINEELNEAFSVMNNNLYFLSRSPEPIIVERFGTSNYKFIKAKEINYEYILSDRPTIIFTGSVGRPMDQDSRSSYITFENNLVKWHRISYDILATVKKIHDNPDLDNFIGDRLFEGR